MDCTIRWLGGQTMSFVAETGSGHSFVMDGAPEGGGRNLGPRPMEVVLSGSAACTAYDVVLILRKSGMQIRACDVEARAERAETDPKVFTKIHLQFTAYGKGLKANLVERAIALSHQKYCSLLLTSERDLHDGFRHSPPQFWPHCGASLRRC
jgi:putative redox protein